MDRPLETAVAWLWTDTLADLLETIDRVEPDALCRLRLRPVAYRLGEDGDPVALARAVLRGLTSPPCTTSDPLRTSPEEVLGLRSSSRPG